MKPLIFSVLLALLILPAFGTEAPVEQTTCPVMVGNPIDPSLHVDYEGQRVYFCCKNCMRMFSENPEQYLNNLPQFASEESAHDHPEEAPNHPTAYLGNLPAAEHHHATDHAAPQKTALLTYLGKFHPVAVHLPIALLIGAALAELIFIPTGKSLFRNAAYFNLSMAVLGAAVAIPLGLAAASGTRYPIAYSAIPELHKWMGLATLGVALVATAMARRTAKGGNPLPYRLTLFTAALLVGATGHLGGLLVYGLNHFSW